MAIQFLTHKNSTITELHEISLLNNQTGYLLGDVACRLVYSADSDPTSTLSATVTRKLGIEFTNLDSKQQTKLNDLLNKHTTAKDSQIH